MARLYYDGNCGLCGWCVNVLGTIGYKGKFCTLENASLPKCLENIDSVVYFREGSFWSGFYIKSDAIILAISDCGVLWKWVLVFLCIPRLLRDWVYDLVAKNRYCRI